MRIVPSAAKLNKRSIKGKSVGYSVLRIDRSTVTNFTTSRVEEVRPQYFVAQKGVKVPYEGGWILWGTKNNVLAEVPVISDVSPQVDKIIASSANASLDVTNALEQIVPDIKLELDDVRTDILLNLRDSISAALSSVLLELRALDSIAESMQQNAISLRKKDKPINEALMLFEKVLGEQLGVGVDHLSVQKTLVDSVRESLMTNTQLEKSIATVSESLNTVQQALLESAGRLYKVEDAIAARTDDQLIIDEKQRQSMRIIQEVTELFG